MSLAWLWSILLVGATVLLRGRGHLLARRWVSVEILKLNNEVAGFIYAVIGVLYAVLLGFTAIIVWEQFDKAQAGVDQEANELADLYRHAQAFPDDTRRDVGNSAPRLREARGGEGMAGHGRTDVKF
jgi:hypothetical protein